MPATVSVSLGTLVDETLASLYRNAERPAQVVLGTNAITSTSDTTFTLASGTLAPSDLVESPSGELMLVTAKSTDSDPVYTVVRGYLGTEKDQSIGQNTRLLKGPSWARSEVKRWVRRAIDGPMNTELPYVEVIEGTPHQLYKYIELDSDVLDVVRVRHFSSITGDVADIGGWSFQEVPTSVAPSGKILRIRPHVDEELILDAIKPYQFTDSTESGTVALPIAAQDIPVLWAAAYGLMRREVSRSELDKIEEWNQEQAIRAGVNLRLVRDAWGEVYRRIDEAKRVHRIAKHRPYRKMAKAW